MQLTKRTAFLLSTLVLLVSCSQILVQRVGHEAQALDVEAPSTTAQALDALRHGPPGDARRLLAAAGSREVPWTLTAAAALDAGEAIPAGRPESLTGSAFDLRLERALERHEQGAQTHLFDRLGRPLGHIDGDGDVQWVEGATRLDLTAKELRVPNDGRGLRLTLDVELARRLERTLQGVQGSVVVLDARDASVLYAGSDRRTHRRRDAASFYEQLEPASIAKMITTTAALRAGLDVDADLKEYRCTGMTLMDGVPLYCTSVKGRLRGGLGRAMASSCNVAFADLGRQIGSAAVLAEYQRFGFAPGQVTDGSTFGAFATQPTERELGDLSIGLNQADLTPLHGAVLARTWIDGDFKAPTLHLAVDSPLGNAPRPGAEDPLAGEFTDRQGVLDPEWLPLLHDTLLEVTSRRGTASLIAPEGFPVAMKTGTGQTEGHGFHTNYVGFAPADEPRFAFAVRVRRGPTSRRTRRATKALTRHVLRVLRDYAPEYEPDPVIVRLAKGVDPNGDHEPDLSGAIAP